MLPEASGFFGFIGFVLTTFYLILVPAPGSVNYALYLFTGIIVGVSLGLVVHNHRAKEFTENPPTPIFSTLNNSDYPLQKV